MKTAFFKLENWEKEFIKNNSVFRELNLETEFIDELLDKDRIPSETDFEVISVFVDSVVNNDVLEKFPKLKFIAARSTGYDHIDIENCQKRGIIVSNVPSYGENTVAEFTFGLILTLSRKIFEASRRVKETGSFGLEALRGFDLKNKTLGVIGTGKIGRHVIRIANGFEMNVIAYDVNPDLELSKNLRFEYLPLEEVLKRSDIVTLHVPYIKETHYLINQNTAQLMKKGAYLINTSRGGVVETEALVKVLRSGHLAGAALDVLEEEGAIKEEINLLVNGHPEEHNLKTILANHVLINLPNVIITPHNAFNSWEGLQRILDTTILNIEAFIKGQPLNVVK